MKLRLSWQSGRIQDNFGRLRSLRGLKMVTSLKFLRSNVLMHVRGRLVVVRRRRRLMTSQFDIVDWRPEFGSFIFESGWSCGRINQDHFSMTAKEWLESSLRSRLHKLGSIRTLLCCVGTNLRSSQRPWSSHLNSSGPSRCLRCGPWGGRGRIGSSLVLSVLTDGDGFYWVRIGPFVPERSSWARSDLWSFRRSFVIPELGSDVVQIKLFIKELLLFLGKLESNSKVLLKVNLLLARTLCLLLQINPSHPTRVQGTKGLDGVKGRPVAFLLLLSLLLLLIVLNDGNFVIDSKFFLPGQLRKVER